MARDPDGPVMAGLMVAHRARHQHAISVPCNGARGSWGRPWGVGAREKSSQAVFGCQNHEVVALRF